MQVGLRAGVKFEVACGGNAECCTCHVKLQDSVIKSPYYFAAESKEIDALDWAVGADDSSRLACQVKLTEAFEGANVRFIGD
jgi:2Fe-2S ferredoxin